MTEYQKAGGGALSMRKNEGFTFGPWVHILGNQTPHQSNHVHPLGPLGGIGGLPYRQLWKTNFHVQLLTLKWKQMTVALWIWTWTVKILSQSTVDLPRENRQTFFHWILNAFWSRQNMTKQYKTCQNIYPTPSVSKSSSHSCPNALKKLMWWLCFVLPCPV